MSNTSVVDRIARHQDAQFKGIDLPQVAPKAEQPTVLQTDWSSLAVDINAPLRKDVRQRIEHHIDANMAPAAP